MAGSSWYHPGALYRNDRVPENWTQDQSNPPSVEYRINQTQNTQNSSPTVLHPSPRSTGYGVQHNDPQSYMSPIGQKRQNGFHDHSSNTFPPPPGNAMGFGAHTVPNNANASMNIQTHLQSNATSSTVAQPPTPPIKIVGMNYFCELCNIQFPIDPNGLLVHRNGKVHEIELLKKLEVLTVIDRQCHCTRCNVSLGFRFQVAVMHYEKAHKGIFKKMVALKELAPVRSEMNMRGRGVGRGRGGSRGRGRGTTVSSATISPASAKNAFVNSSSVDAQKGLPKGFKITNNTYYCEICSMPLPIDVDLMQHCFGRNHEIKLLIAEGVLSMNDNKCTCELCKKELGFGFKAALKHVREHHKDEYRKIQSSKELGSVQKFQDASDKSPQPPKKKSKMAPAGESCLPFNSNSTSTVAVLTTQLDTASSRASDKEKGLVIDASLASVKSGDGTRSAVRKTRWSNAEDDIPPGCSTDPEEKVEIKQECVTSTEKYIKQECVTSSDISIKQEYEFSNTQDNGGHTKESSKSSTSSSKASARSIPSPSRSSSKSSSRTSLHSSSKFSSNSHHSPSRCSSNSSSRSSYYSSKFPKSSSAESSNDRQKSSGKSVDEDRSCYDMNY